LNTKENQVYVAVTRSQQIWRLPLMADGQPAKTGVAIQLSGGHAGPDGIEMDAEDGLVVCHLGIGVWRFDANCLPTHLVHAVGARLMTNTPLGAAEGKTLYIPAPMNGEILTARMPVAGRRMYGPSCRRPSTPPAAEKETAMRRTVLVLATIAALLAWR